MSDKLEATFSALGLCVGKDAPRASMTPPAAPDLADELIAAVNAYISHHPFTTRQQVLTALRTAAARVAESPPG
jgi:hypothetical protein